MLFCGVYHASLVLSFCTERLHQMLHTWNLFMMKNMAMPISVLRFMWKNGDKSQ